MVRIGLRIVLLGLAWAAIAYLCIAFANVRMSACDRREAFGTVNVVVAVSVLAVVVWRLRSGAKSTEALAPMAAGAAWLISSWLACYLVAALL